MADSYGELLRDTLDLLILKSLTWGTRHGYAIAEWIDTATGRALLVEEGTLYPALHRLEHQGLIEAAWGLSDDNRRARYYALSALGRRRLRAETEVWQEYAEAVGRALAWATSEAA